MSNTKLKEQQIKLQLTKRLVEFSDQLIFKDKDYLMSLDWYSQKIFSKNEKDTPK